MDISAYLQRIQIKNIRKPDLAFLTELQQQHELHIVFENLDILRGKKLSLDIEQLFHKIVLQGRGGVCYELNLLFHTLLQELGFQPSIVAATTFNGQEWTKIEETHLSNLVPLEGQIYLVDVGFGGNSPRKPIPLTGEQTSDGVDLYRVSKIDHPAADYVLQKQEDGQWKHLYRFREEARKADFFEEKCRLIEKSPHSPFNKRPFLSRVTETGRMTLTDRSLTLVEGDQKEKRPVSDKEWPQVLEQYFGINSSIYG